VKCFDDKGEELLKETKGEIIKRMQEVMQGIKSKESTDCQSLNLERSDSLLIHDALFSVLSEEEDSNESETSGVLAHMELENFVSFNVPRRFATSTF